VDFGCVLTDTCVRASVKLTNPGKARVQYAWAWLGQDGAPGDGDMDATDPAAPGTLTRGGALAGSSGGPRTVCGGGEPLALPPAAAFDILPIRGVLEPGESEELDVSYFGRPGSKASATAVCHITDGPDLQVGRPAAPLGGVSPRAPLPCVRLTCPPWEHQRPRLSLPVLRAPAHAPNPAADPERGIQQHPLWGGAPVL
jgi:hypothetical protein